jgi:hypothetical protein
MTIHNKQFDITVHVKHMGKRTIIGIPGTDHWRDIRQALKCWGWNHQGYWFHYGAWEGVESVWEQIKAAIPSVQEKIVVQGHSLGGSYAQIVAWRLTQCLRGHGKEITLEAYNSFPAVGRRAMRKVSMEAWTHFIYGNDPVALLFRWWKFPGGEINEPPRKFPWLDLRIVSGDHVRR